MKSCCLKCLEHLKLFSCSSISHRETMEQGSCVMMSSHLPYFLKPLLSLLVRIAITYFVDPHMHGLRALASIISEPSPVLIDATNFRLQTANISWSSLSQSMYTLTITNTHNQPQILKLNQSYYGFTAPEGAPPCEVYNFSVTATYVGATYTGAGCSVPSHVLSKMLPSLPIIGPPAYTLLKHSAGINLNSSFEVYVLISHLYSLH